MSVLSAGHNKAVWVCYFLESMNIIIVSDAEERIFYLLPHVLNRCYEGEA